MRCERFQRLSISPSDKRHLNSATGIGLLSEITGRDAFPTNGRKQSNHHITHKAHRYRPVIAIAVGLVAGKHEKLAGRNGIGHLTHR